MKHLLLSLALCISLLAGAHAQILTDKGSKSDLTNQKMHEIDILLQVLPLLLTKDQINTKILPAIEKSRQLLRTELQLEDDALAKMDPLLDESITAAYEKGAYPARKVTDEVAKTTASFNIKRKFVEIQMVAAMTDVLKETLNAGQKKVMANSFDPKFINPDVKPDTISEDMKTNFFVERIFMDPMTYDVLIKLAKIAA